MQVKRQGEMLLATGAQLECIPLSTRAHFKGGCAAVLQASGAVGWRGWGVPPALRPLAHVAGWSGQHRWPSDPPVWMSELLA